MKTYVGTRGPNGCVVEVRDERGIKWSLPLRLEVWNHSPTGFEWGYGGSGPAQLALAILMDHLTGTDGAIPIDARARAVRLHQDFKGKVVAGMPRDGWTLTGTQVENIVKELETNAAQARTT